MSRSWGHTLRRLTDEELARRVRVTTPSWAGGKTFEHRDECGWPKCHELQTYEGTYQYVTGRAGRVSWARKPLCDDHAERFKAKHDPAVLLPGEGREHAIQTAMSVLIGPAEQSGTVVNRHDGTNGIDRSSRDERAKGSS